MARRVIWSPSALRDVDEVAAHIGRSSPKYAAAFVRRVFRTAEGVELFPEAGALVPEYERTDLREVFVGNYRLIYRFTEDEVFIQTFIHGARDLRRVWSPDQE
jgi:plasmid stabilization system protein ParE